jgi:TIR domain
MSAPIFISFASKDLSVAYTVCEALENRGFNCWISSRDIGPGENFQVAIVRAIRLAKVMILVFSGHSNISEEVKKELVLAGQSRLVVIPLRVEDVAPDEAFAYEFATRQWIDAFHDWEHAIQRVVDQLLLVDGLERTSDAGLRRSALPRDGGEQPRQATGDKREESGRSAPVSPNVVSAGASRGWRWIAVPALGFAVLAIAILIWFGLVSRTPTTQKADIGENTSPPRVTPPNPLNRNPTTQKADLAANPSPPRATPRSLPPPSTPTVQQEASTSPVGPGAEASNSISIVNPRISEIGNETQRTPPNTQLKTPNSDLLGLWDGSSTCDQGEIGVELSLKETRADRMVLGTLRFFNLPGHNNTGEGEYTLQGRYYDKDSMLYLQPGVWIRQPPGYSMASFSFTLESHGPMLIGRVTNAACSTISVTKVGSPAAPPSATPRPSG